MMKLTKYKCNATWIELKMCGLLIKMFSDSQTNFINVPEISKLTKRALSHNMMTNQWKRLFVGVISCILNSDDLDDIQMHFIQKIDYVNVIKTSRSIKRDPLQSIQLSLRECRENKCNVA